MSDLERSIDAALHRAVLRPGLRVDHLGDERVVLDAASGVVHTVRGAAVKALDAIVRGRPAPDADVLAALAGAGIVEVRGVTRRDALVLAGSATALVASIMLPSAVAAASTFSLPAGSGGGSATTTEFTLASGHRLYRLFDAAESDLDTSFRLSVTAPTVIEVLLVGGGGPGGQAGSSVSAEFFGGGGGGGEVAFVALGTVSAGTALDFTVAGNASFDIRNSGRDTTLSIGTDSVTALGGGQGAARIGTTLTAAVSGGSGGGGNPSNTAGGSSGSGAVSLSGSRTRTSTRVHAGGTGTAVRAAAGGGGALEPGGSASTETSGGKGGDGITLAAATGWDLTVLSGPDPTAVQNIFGSGGGGAGAAAGGTSNSGDDQVGAFRSTATAAQAGSSPRLTSGAGGGGGIRVARLETGFTAADPGSGGSGVVWVRTIA
jgi:hypothetical protein